MMNKRMSAVVLTLVATMLLTVMSAEAADGDFVWAKSMGCAATYDRGYGIVVDSAGNVYTTGLFQDTADFDPGPGIFNLVSLGGMDIFVSKFNSAGNFVWAKSMGGTLNDQGSGIAVDSAGNVYTTGYFRGTADFDPGPGTFNLISAAGTDDIFVSKMDSDGNFFWAKCLGGTMNDQGYGIAVDSADNVYTTGCFRGTVDFDPGSETFNLTSAGLYDIFVSKLDNAGDFVWAKSLGGTMTGIGYDIAVDSAGNVYTTGYFSDTVDFDPGPETFDLVSVGEMDIFVLKMDSVGNFVWAKSMGGMLSDIGYGIAVDSVGNVYTTGNFLGSFSDTVDFDPGPETLNLTCMGFHDIFILKLDNAGDFVWAKSMGGTMSEKGYGIAVDSAGNVYTTGTFSDTVDFDPSSGTFNLISAGFSDIFVFKLDNAGDFVWAGSIGGSSFDNGSDIAVDSMGDVYITGDFAGSVDFDPGPGTFNMTTVGSADIFVLKLSGPPAAVSVVSATASPTNSTTVIFDVTFDEDVVNFDAESDLITTEAGTVMHTGATITGGPIDYTVELTGVSGDGNITLAVSTLSDVEDLAGNPLGLSVTSAAVVIDNMPPSIAIGAPSATLVNGAATVTLAVTYTDAISVNLTADDVTVNVEAGTASADVAVIDGTTTAPTIELANLTGDGTITVSIAGGTSQDAVGNTDTGAGPGEVITVDNTPPGISVGLPSVATTTSGPVEYEVTYTDENIVTLAPGDITLDVTGDVTATVSILPASTVELSNITGTGTLGFTIAAGTAVDAAGNLCGPASTTDPVTVEPGMPLAIWSAAAMLLVCGIVIVRWRREKEEGRK